MKKLYYFLPLVYAASVAANIRELGKGNTASWVGTGFAAVFLLAWIVFLILFPSKSFKLLMFGYWAITGVLAAAILAGNLNDFSMEFLIPGIVLFITPVYGVSIKGMSAIMTSITILIISLLFCGCSLFRKGKTKAVR